MRYMAKQQAAGSTCLVCAVGMVVCLGRMIPAGLGGETRAVKVYFTIMMVAFVVSFVSAVLYYRYRSLVATDTELLRMRTELEVLAKSARRPKPAPKRNGK